MSWRKLNKSIGIQKLVGDTKMITVVAKPLNSNLSDAKKKEILTERYNILKIVSDYINEYLTVRESPQLG